MQRIEIGEIHHQAICSRHQVVKFGPCHRIQSANPEQSPQALTLPFHFQDNRSQLSHGWLFPFWLGRLLATRFRGGFGGLAARV
jgi:hypothetical protein